MQELPDNSRNKYLVPAVEQAVQVLLCLADSGSSPKSLTDICSEVGIHRSKAFSILNTLSEYSFVKKNPNRKGYVLGPGLLRLTGKMLETLSLSRYVEPILYDLAKKAGATVALGVIADDKTYVIAEYQGAPGIGISAPIGHVTPVTYGAHGKAIAASLPETEIGRLLEADSLYFYGNPEKFNRARFMEDISTCRKTGYAVEFGDIMPGVNAVAAPVLNRDGKPIGYVSVVGFFTEEMAGTIGPLTAAAVKEISRETGHMIIWQKAARNGKQIQQQILRGGERV